MGKAIELNHVHIEVPARLLSKVFRDETRCSPFPIRVWQREIVQNVQQDDGEPPYTARQIARACRRLGQKLDAKTSVVNDPGVEIPAGPFRGRY